MSREAQIITEVWDAIRDYIPASKRSDAAHSMVRVFADRYDADAADLSDLTTEEAELAEAYETIFGSDLEDDVEEDYDDEE